MLKNIFPILVSFLILLLPAMPAETDTTIIFREIGDGIEVNNSYITLHWEKHNFPAVKILAERSSLSINNFTGYEIKDISKLQNFSQDIIVSKTELDNSSGWIYTTSRILSGKGFQIKHSQSLPVSSSQRTASFSVANTVSNGELYYYDKKIETNENIQIITLSNWPWTNYDDILAVRVFVDSDLVVDGELEPLSRSGPGIRAVSPYATSAKLLQNNQECGIIKWNHEAEIQVSRSKSATLVRVYAEPKDTGTDIIFVFFGSYGAEQVSYSYLIQVTPKGNFDNPHINYTLEVVSGVVVILVLAVVMFRAKRK